MKRKQKRNRVYGNWKSYSVFSIGNWKKAAAIAEWMVCARPGPSLNWVFDGCATISSVFIFCFALFMSCLFTWLHFTLVYCFNLNARLAIGTHSHTQTHTHTQQSGTLWTASTAVAARGALQLGKVIACWVIIGQSGPLKGLWLRPSLMYFKVSFTFFYWLI